MKIDKLVQRELDTIPVPYTITKKKDHYYAEVKGYPRILVAGNHDRVPCSHIRKTIFNIRKLIATLGDSNG